MYTCFVGGETCHGRKTQDVADGLLSLQRFLVRFKDVYMVHTTNLNQEGE